MMRILRQWSKVYVHLAITMPDRIVQRLVGSTRKKAFTIRWWKKLGAAVATLKSGAPDDESTELGPLSSLAHLERVSKAVEEAKATGHIKVITGGEKRKGNGYYYAPTLLAGALQDDAIVQKRGIWSSSECYTLRQRRTGGKLGE